MEGDFFDPKIHGMNQSVMALKLDLKTQLVILEMTFPEVKLDYIKVLKSEIQIRQDRAVKILRSIVEQRLF